MNSLPVVLQQWICLLFGILGIVYLVFEGLPAFGRKGLGLRAKSLGDDADDSDPDEELCDACKYDVRGLTTCPECGRPTRKARRDALAKLRDEWPAQDINPRKPEPGEKACMVLEANDHMAGQLLCQHLRARGIERN